MLISNPPPFIPQMWENRVLFTLKLIPVRKTGITETQLLGFWF
jgi:hypothetical protein